MSTESIKKWWEDNAEEYQDENKIPIDISYGPGAPNEDRLKLLGNLSGKHILEIGCGAAQCGIAFAKKGAEVIGMDISKTQLRIAGRLSRKEKVKINLIQGNIEDLSLIKSLSQDIVFSSWALMYVSDLRKCFKEVHRVLKSKGILVFSLNHPFWDRIDKESLKIKKPYLKTGIYDEFYKKGVFMSYSRTIGEIVNNLADEGFFIEKIVEPNSGIKNVGDSWYDKERESRREAMKWIPRTIIFKARKL